MDKEMHLKTKCSNGQMVEVHPVHRHLKVTYANEYEGIDLMTAHAPYVVAYLDRLRGVISTALQAHAKIFAVRVDLRLPARYVDQPDYDNRVLEDFVRSLRARIDGERQRRAAHCSSVASCPVRYVWAREQVAADQPHYHLLLVFNGNFYQSLGSYDPRVDNLASFIVKSWATALGRELDVALPLVHWPHHCAYKTDRYNASSTAALLARASYLCKMQTKVLDDGMHSFGASRV